MRYRVNEQEVNKQEFINKMLTVMAPERANYWLATMESCYCIVEKAGIQFQITPC